MQNPRQPRSLAANAHHSVRSQWAYLLVPWVMTAHRCPRPPRRVQRQTWFPSYSAVAVAAAPSMWKGQRQSHQRASLERPGRRTAHPSSGCKLLYPPGRHPVQQAAVRHTALLAAPRPPQRAAQIQTLRFGLWDQRRGCLRRLAPSLGWSAWGRSASAQAHQRAAQASYKMQLPRPSKKKAKSGQWHTCSSAYSASCLVTSSWQQVKMPNDCKQAETRGRPVHAWASSPVGHRRSAPTATRSGMGPCQPGWTARPPR